DSEVQTAAGASAVARDLTPGRPATRSIAMAHRRESACTCIRIAAAIAVIVSSPSFAQAQRLSAKWEELTAVDFVRALDAAANSCLLPFGIIEKHGPAGPLGTDLINVRYTTLLAAAEEYALVFPEYYVGQIFEAKHQPGTVAYSSRLQL